MYNNPYIKNYNNLNQQNMYEQIDNQINQLQQMREQIRNNSHQQQPAINQTFQLAPTGAGTIKYANSLEDVEKETVFSDTAFFSKDLSVMWLKNPKGNIKAYELTEIIQKDEKDLQIELLTAQVNELKGMIENERTNTNVNAEQTATDTTKYDEPVREAVKSTKPTGVSEISRSKKKQ